MNPHDDKSNEHPGDSWFRVEVTDRQGQVVAIETEMLTGRCDLGDAEYATIEKAVRALSGFIALPSPAPASELVEKLDGLYAKATPGPWRYEEESDGQRMWGEVWATDGGENYQIIGPQFNPFSAELVAALVNAWPAIRSLLLKEENR